MWYSYEGVPPSATGANPRINTLAARRTASCRKEDEVDRGSDLQLRIHAAPLIHDGQASTARGEGALPVEVRRLSRSIERGLRELLGDLLGVTEALFDDLAGVGRIDPQDFLRPLSKHSNGAGLVHFGDQHRHIDRGELVHVRVVCPVMGGDRLGDNVGEVPLVGRRGQAPVYPFPDDDLTYTDHQHDNTIA